MYSEAQRRNHLESFVSTTAELVTSETLKEQFPDARENYLECLTDARMLLHDGFDQTQLTELCQKFQPLYWTNPHCPPPLIETEPGRFTTPDWFKDLDDLHNRAYKAAQLLKVTGEY